MKRGCSRWIAAVVALGAMNLQAISIQEEIDAAAAKGGGLVVVPSGEHFSDGPIRLKSNVELHLEEGATIVFSDDPAKYLPAVPTSWEGVECLNYSPLVYAYGCTNVAITGKGTFAPRMKFWRKWFARDAGHRAATRKLYDWCSFNAPLGERDLTKLPESNVRPHLIQFNRCKDVRLDGFRIRESPFWTIHLFLCDGVVARGLDVYAHGHNNDGIDIEMTRNVLVENCRFDQGDDAIVIKSGRNQDAWRLATPSENIEIRNCTVVNGHVLLGIGSEMSGGVRNVYMHDCTLESEAFRLFYVKTNERRGGFVENIRMEGVRARKVRHGVMSVETDVLYQWRDFPTHEVRVTPIRNLSMKDVAVEEAERLVHILGDKRLPVDGVTLENVRVGKVMKPDRIENAVNVSVNPVGVRYRGIFINDEDWGLRPWAVRHFGKDEQIGTNAYAEVFALMRKNGLNLIWPAMHEGGYEFSSRPENLALAAKEGIVVGTSHCEPMLRNNCYLSKADKKKWSWVNNRAFLEEYWREGVRRGSTFAKATVDKTGNGERGTGVLWTIGMRGIHDGKMQDGKTTADKRKILEEVFAAQCTMLPEGVPKLFIPYKEVLPIFNAGLKVPKGATIMWTNDNFGYVRRLGGPQCDGYGGGIYWHVSYHGSPHGYIHLCTTPPAFMWYELVAKCWANGARDVWMVNAGDVFQAEVLLDAYGRFAANPEAWGPDAQGKGLGMWVDECFLQRSAHAEAQRGRGRRGACIWGIPPDPLGEAAPENLRALCLSAPLRDKIVAHLAEYYNLGFNRKPEHMCVQWTTNLPASVKSSLLKRYHALLAEDIAIESALPERLRERYFRLVGFQARFLAYAGIIHLEARGKDYARSVIDPLYERWDKIDGGKWSGFWCDTIDERGGKRQPTKHNRWSSQMQWPWNEPADPTAKDRGVARMDYPATAYRADVEEPSWIEPVANTPANGGAWTRVPGLGTSGMALALLPVKPGVGKGAMVEYSIGLRTSDVGLRNRAEVLSPKSEVLVLQFLPDFALWPGLKLGVEVEFVRGDGTLAAEKTYVAVPKSDSGIGEHDRIRNQAVQDNFIRVEVPVPMGAKSVRIVAADPGVVIDKVGVRAPASVLSWPKPTKEMKPWAYNWWMGSAVDEKGLEHQCREFADKGFGGFHVIPIYGANGPGNCYRSQWKELLSTEWIGAWNEAARLAGEHGLGIDLTTGSGWCFGGPWIDKVHAASSGMKVKRAGPGGHGYMLDPFDPEAMKIHVAQFDRWFGKNGTAARPRAFYHDSYEYYGAKPKHGEDVDESQLACFKVWTDWCRDNGYITRNEAHGSPCNWLDFYALADIPETEMFGKGDRDILISKFASSAAHAKGTKLVAAESCTWIDEHFRERPAEIKAFVDRLFLSGVNHVFYHGCCYSPVDAVWPGWCFYASLEMNPRNPIWREMGALNAYVTRCQSIFQTWTPDNDMALVWDPASFRAKHKGEVVQMSVHAREWFYDEPIGKVAKEMYDAGYAFDYVSPRMVAAGLAKKYAMVIDPAEWGKSHAEAQRRGDELSRGVRKMPFDAAGGLLATRWRKDGETAYFVVNTGKVEKVVAAGGAMFGVMDPLTGGIATSRREAVKIAPGHSLFLVGDGFAVGEDRGSVNHGSSKKILGPWSVSPVCGGPALPAPRTLDVLAGWETFDEFFSGTMLYKAAFDGNATAISLGDVREIARVRLNGRDIGVRFMAPYEFAIPDGVLKEKGNVLEVEVTNLGSNRLRWNDMNKVEWKYFTDINMVGADYKKLDASKWSVLKSGLLGPVELRQP